MVILIGLLIYHIALISLSKFFPKKKIFTILKYVLFILPLILICSLKSKSVGIDTENYLYLYNDSITSFEGGAMPSEKGFVLFMYICRKLNLPFFVFLLILFSITFTCISVFCHKKSENPLFLMFFITYFGLLGFALSAIRQTLAVGIILLGFAFFDRKKPISIISPILFTILAMFIHRTSFLILPVALFLLIKMDKNSFIYLVLIGLIIAVLSPNIYSFVVLEIDSHLYPIKSETMWTLIVYILFAILILLLSYKRVEDFEMKRISKYEDNKFLSFFSGNTTNENNQDTLSYTTFYAYMVYSIIVLIVGFYSSVFGRINYYAIAFTGLLLINEINKSKHLKVTRGTINCLLVLFLCIYYVYSVLIKDPLYVAHYSFGPIMF